MPRPSDLEIKVFIDMVNRLSIFEAEHRLRCGWGAYSTEDKLPIPEAMATLAWLKDLIGSQD